VDEQQQQIQIENIFHKVYNKYTNRSTPKISRYYGSVCDFGKPDKSEFICELSQGIFGGDKIPIYGVTVIQYNTCTGKWEKNLAMSGVTTVKIKAETYASELGFTGKTSVKL
jgi:hypothetical protein